MAKSKSETADEKAEQQTLREYAAADDSASEREMKANASPKDGIAEPKTEPEPEEPPVPLSPAEAWLVEAREIASVKGKGEAYSPERITAMMLQAIPLAEALVEAQTKPQ